MIYRIAEPPPGGKGLVGIYPAWGDDGTQDALILERQRASHFSLLFTRNYAGQFFGRIAAPLSRYGQYVDIVCGWELERIRMFFLPLNPAVEVFPLSAMHFNTFDLIDQVREQLSTGQIAKRHDLFFAMSDRPDRLKNVKLLVQLLSKTTHPLKVVGYGRVSRAQRRAIAANPALRFSWCGKADIIDPEQRLQFLRDLAQSQCLLVTSRAEGYSRLIGEALLLRVPVLLFTEILCENWVHLNADNCRLFTVSTFEACLREVLSRDWDFSPPEYADGNQALRQCFEDYLNRRGLPVPVTWHRLGYGALPEERVEPGDAL
jgi:glycosyltransferase involved in cell wall biosynthesis